MATFQKAYQITALIEGGWADDPDDSGGPTWKGISRKYEPAWPGWLIVDKLKHQPNFPHSLSLNKDLQGLVLSQYKKNYWDVLNLDQLQSDKVANELFDTAVNCGVTKASKILQEALNLTNNNGKLYPDISIDGKVGPVTIKLTNNHPRPNLLYKVLNALQGEYYMNIMRFNPSQEVFANTWFSRVFEAV